MKLNATVLLGVALCLSYASAFNGVGEEAVASARKRLRGTSYASLSSTSLLIAEPRQLSRISLRPPSRRLIERSPFVGGLDYHAGRNLLYWSEISLGRINARNLSGPSDFEAEAFFELSPREWRPRAIAVDWLSDKMYVLDTRGKRVHVLELASSRRRSVILEGGLRAPSDMALDPERALVFVADGTRLLRFNMDGSDLRTLISHPRYRIKALALDPANRRVFWSDLAFHRIASADYEGGDARVLLKNQVGSRDYSVLGPAQLSYYAGSLYFYDDVYRSISALEVDAQGRALKAAQTRLLYDRLDVRAIKVLNSRSQSPQLLASRNPCELENAGCQHICLVARKLQTGELSGKCACELGKKLADDAKSCI